MVQTSRAGPRATLSSATGAATRCGSDGCEASRSHATIASFARCIAACLAASASSSARISAWRFSYFWYCSQATSPPPPNTATPTQKLRTCLPSMQPPLGDAFMKRSSIDVRIVTAVLVCVSSATLAQERPGRPHEKTRSEEARQEQARNEGRARDKAAGDRAAHEQQRTQQNRAAEQAAENMRRAAAQSKAAGEALARSGTTSSKSNEVTQPTVPNVKPADSSGGANRSKAPGKSK